MQILRPLLDRHSNHRASFFLQYAHILPKLPHFCAVFPTRTLPFTSYAVADYSTALDLPARGRKSVLRDCGIRWSESHDEVRSQTRAFAILPEVSRMTQPFDVFSVTDSVAVSAGMLIELFQPLIAQADVPLDSSVPTAPVEFLPQLWNTVRSYLDINVPKSLLLAHGGKVVAAIAVFFIGRTVARFTTSMMVRAAKKARVDQTLVGFISNVSYILMLGIVCIASLSSLGVDTTSFTAVLAAAGFAIGMALQGTLGNCASGVLLVFFKPFRVGDTIDVGGVSGSVVEV